MEKYELIEKYPGSPEIGTIVEEDRLGQFITTNSPLVIFTADDIKNYPKNWRKVYDEDFLILSYWQSEGLVIQTEGVARSMDLEDFRKKVRKNEVLIQSVKRLSDGKVISVGSYYYPKGVGAMWGVYQK